MVAGVEVVDRFTVADGRSRPSQRSRLLASAHLLGYTSPIGRIDVADVYFVAGRLDDAVRRQLESVLVDPLLQQGTWGTPPPHAGVIEAALLPGVTDSVAATVLVAAATMELPGRSGRDGSAVRRHHHAMGDPPTTTCSSPSPPICCRTRSSNASPSARSSRCSCTPRLPPRLELDRGPRPVGRPQLAELNRSRGMALDPAELRVDRRLVHRRRPRAHRRRARDAGPDLERALRPQDVPRRHHAARRDRRCTPLLAPAARRHRRPSTRRSCAAPSSATPASSRSCPGTTVAVKAETHNHPSAIEPFGGANTGVGGVIRDVMGAAHHPIATTDMLCFGPTDLPPTSCRPGVLHPPPRPRGRRRRRGRLRQQDRPAHRGRRGAVRPRLHRQPAGVLRLHRRGRRTGAAHRPAARRPGRRARRPHRPRRPARRHVLQRHDGRHHRRRRRRQRADRRSDHREAADRRCCADATHLYTADHRLRRRRAVVGDRRDGRGRRRRCRPGARPAEVPGPGARGRSGSARRRSAWWSPCARPRWPTCRPPCRRHGVESTVLGTFTGDGVLRVRHGERAGARARHRRSCTTAARSGR